MIAAWRWRKSRSAVVVGTVIRIAMLNRLIFDLQLQKGQVRD
jgi:hypothetical protein